MIPFETLPDLRLPQKLEYLIEALRYKLIDSDLHLNGTFSRV